MPSRNFRPQKLTRFARLLFAEWRQLKLPVTNEAIVVAVSGGADSIALLLALDELKRAGKITLTLFVAHLDHGLRTSSTNDAKWVSCLAKSLGYASIAGRAKVKEIARVRADNLEQAARRTRYEFLERTAKRKGARFVLTAHTMDDQAETVLLRLMRGSAGIGLAGMERRRPISGGSKIHLARPLLWARRNDSVDYCVARKQQFLSDEMNEDERFVRVKVRKQLLPLMRSFNNKIVEALSRTATLLREDNSVLFNDADDLLRRAAIKNKKPAGRGKPTTPMLDVHVLAGAPPALRRRALRQWISEARGDTRRLEMVHFMAVEKLLEGNLGGRTVELPSGARVRRKGGLLEIEAEND